MAPSRQFRPLIAYLVCVAALILLALGVKAGAALLAHRLLYPIPILGGIVRTLELLELLNILVFAILGLGLGAAAQLFPHRHKWQVNRILLIVLIPLVFLSGSLLNYQIWLGQVQEAAGISPSETRILTDQWLQETVNQKGFFGFYRFTARYTTLPIRTEEVAQAKAGSERVGETLGRLVSLEPEQMVGWLTLTTWAVRLFYFALASVIAINYFQEGVWQAQQQPHRSRRRSANSANSTKSSKSSKSSRSTKPTLTPEPPKPSTEE